MLRTQTMCNLYDLLSSEEESKYTFIKINKANWILFSPY